MMWPAYCTEWIWRRRSRGVRGVREEGRIPRCSRTAGVELKMEPDDPRMMIWVFRAAIVRVVPVVVGKRG